MRATIKWNSLPYSAWDWCVYVSVYACIICMYVCMYIYIYIMCMHYLHVCTGTGRHRTAEMGVYMCMYAYMCMCVLCVYALPYDSWDGCVYVRMRCMMFTYILEVLAIPCMSNSTETCIYIYIHTYMYIYIHTHNIYIYIYIYMYLAQAVPCRFRLPLTVTNSNRFINGLDCSNEKSLSQRVRAAS